MKCYHLLSFNLSILHIHPVLLVLYKKSPHIDGYLEDKIMGIHLLCRKLRLSLPHP